MDRRTRFAFAAGSLRIGTIALALLASPLGKAATLWTGPNLTYTKSASTPTDTVLAGKVVLKRNSSNVLYNTAAGERGPGATSPADTEWGFGALADATTLAYQSMDSLRNGNLAGVIVGKPMVMHIISQDIYLSIKFTAWGQHGAGGVSYVRSTPPAAATAPVVSLTSPSAGAMFAAPATIALAANATVDGGTVTNVEYFANTTSLGKAGTTPFNVTGTITDPGAYSLTAVATASGVSSTSAVVNITIIAPATPSLSSASISNGSFGFDYSADPGLTYLIQASTNLADWLPVSTNVATANPAHFAETLSTSTARFYRVGRVPSQ